MIIIFLFFTISFALNENIIKILSNTINTEDLEEEIVLIDEFESLLVSTKEKIQYYLKYVKDMKENEPFNQKEMNTIDINEIKLLQEDIRDYNSMIISDSNPFVGKIQKVNKYIDSIQSQIDLEIKVFSIQNEIVEIKEKNITHQSENGYFIENFLSFNELHQLEEWTQMKHSEIVFDSENDDWDIDTSVFDKRVFEKSNLLFIVEDTTNNTFGYYFNETLHCYKLNIKGNGSFLFSLKSNGRINKMLKFEEKEKAKGFILYDHEHDILFGMSSGFFINKPKSLRKSTVFENSKYFEYYNYTHVFHEKLQNGKQQHFIPKRIVVIQMI